MAQTTIIEEKLESFDSVTGEIHETTKHKISKSHIEPTDEFIKVSKYLNVIFAYNGIPLSLVPISLIFAQRMEFKTNKLILLKDDKEEIAEMLGCGLERVRGLIKDCKKYDIIRPLTRGKYEVNGFLFSTGSIAETRALQAHFDFDREAVVAQAEQKNLITGAVVRKSVIDANEKQKSKKQQQQLPGQLSLDDLFKE